MRYSLYAGLGDQTLWLSLLHNVHGPKTLVCPPGREQIARLFEGRSYDELVVSDDRSNTFPLWHGAYIGDELAYLAGKRFGNMANIVRYILGLPITAPMIAPRWSAENWLHAVVRMRDLGLPFGRTALVSPYSHTNPSQMSERWWDDLVGTLQARGFTVATNTANRGRAYDNSRFGEAITPLAGTVAADVPLSEIGPFAELCGFVFALDSGLPYLLSRVPTRLCVFWEKPAGSPWFQAWSVRRVFQAEHVVELHPKVGEPFDPAILPDWRPYSE